MIIDLHQNLNAISVQPFNFFISFHHFVGKQIADNDGTPARLEIIFVAFPPLYCHFQPPYNLYTHYTFVLKFKIKN